MFANIFVPLNQPLYGASFGQAVSRFFKKYATFSGRASRSEYWWVQLFLWLISIVPGILIAAGSADAASNGQYVTSNALGVIGLVLAFLIAIATVIPTLALTWRRLHDANLSGWFYLLILVPGVGGLIIFILSLLPSNPAGARFDQ